VLSASPAGGAEAVLDLDDGEILKRVLGELRNCWVDGGSGVTRIARWRRSMAQYRSGTSCGWGYPQQNERLPGLYLAGNAYDGIGVPDCIAVDARRRASARAPAPADVDCVRLNGSITRSQESHGRKMRLTFEHHSPRPI